MKCEVVAGMHQGGRAVGITGCKHIPTVVYMQASPRILPGTVHVSNIGTDLTKSAPNPRAPAHRGLWRISRIINKKNMLTAVRWRSFITHAGTHGPAHKCTRVHVCIPHLFRRQRGVWCTCSSLVVHALCTHFPKLHGDDGACYGQAGEHTTVQECLCGAFS